MTDYRKKYEKARDTCIEWEKFYIEKNEELKQKDETISKLYKIINELPDKDAVLHLEEEIKSLKRELKRQKEKYEAKIVILERDKLLSDGKLQQLEDAKKDLRERYNELKQDYRDIVRNENRNEFLKKA